MLDKLPGVGELTHTGKLDAREPGDPGVGRSPEKAQWAGEGTHKGTPLMHGDGKPDCCIALRYTTLLHHVNEKLLLDSFYLLKKQAAPGVDRVTWGECEEGVEARIGELHDRIHRGAYRAQPSRRVYIPKPDGRQRPLGIAALEDKIVQQAVVEVLNQIYEGDFAGFSYGFRPGRSAHDALDSLGPGAKRQR